MKKDKAIDYIDRQLEHAAREEKITVSMLDVDNRRKMAEWIYTYFRI